MGYRDFYFSVQNPIQVNGTIDKILNAYTENDDFYCGLTSAQEEKKSGFYNVEDANRLTLLLFHDWKSSILFSVQNQIVKEEYQEMATALVRYLATCHPKNAQEVNDILEGKMISDPVLKEAIDTFRWTRAGEFSGWKHVISSYVNVGKHQRQTIEHRLYINCDSTKTHFIGYQFIEKCNERGLSYYFKYDPVGDRDDSLVFYCDTTHLPIYVQILEEIRREHHLDSAVHTPPLLTGRIYDWIGYGSEPEAVNGELVSFNEKREKHLEKCIRQETCSWIRKNIGSTVRRNGKEISFSSYFLSLFVEAKRDRILRYSDQEYLTSYYGCSKQDLYSNAFISSVYQVVKEHMKEISDYYAGKIDHFFLLKFLLEKEISTYLRLTWILF